MVVCSPRSHYRSVLWRPMEAREAADRNVVVVVKIRKGMLTAKQIAGDLAQVIAGEVAGRPIDHETTIFKSAGFALQDIVAGIRAYESVSRSRFGQEIDLQSPFPLRFRHWESPVFLSIRARIHRDKVWAAALRSSQPSPRRAAQIAVVSIGKRSYSVSLA